jgi:acetyl esterase/lipase
MKGKTSKEQPISHDLLLTQKALELSLSPPRCPPHGTAHRSRLAGKHKEHYMDHAYVHDHPHDQAHSDYNKHSGLREALSHLIYSGHNHHYLPHPHVAGPQWGDQVTRWLGTVLPLSWQHSVRDSGGFRTISDTLVTTSIPLAAVTHPRVAARFLKLSRRVQRLQYGDHDYQFIDVLFPNEDNDVENTNGLIFFVHGGAWGSGKPWFYRMIAESFLPRHFVVAIVGYRVYPDADANGQVQDLFQASRRLANEYPALCGHERIQRKYGTCVMGHSSGAHIALNMIVQRAQQTMHAKRTSNEADGQKDVFHIDSFVGISGPYQISHHFDYEAARGVEELSPMKPACGYSRNQFRLNSCVTMLQDAMLKESSDNDAISPFFPARIGLFHGIEDETVPFTATGECARGLRACGIDQCEEIYVRQTGHQDAAVHLMLGGPTKDAILDWLETSRSDNLNPGDNPNWLRSKL